MALLLGALTLLCGAGVARAQGSPGYAANGYSQGYGFGARTAPVSYWYSGYGQASSYAPYNQGYGYSPYYSYYYPYYAAYYQQYYQNYRYPQYASPQYSYPSSSAPASTEVVLPTFPLSSDTAAAEAAPDSGAMKAADEPAYHDRFWVSADYDASWIKPWHMSTPLVTTGPPQTAASPPGYHAAGLGQPGTGILQGDSANFGMFNGIRMGIGFYLDDCDRLSVEWLGVYNIANHVRFNGASDQTGNPIIGRPIYDTNLNAELAYQDSNPGFFSGGTNLDMCSQFLGSELNTHYEFRPSDHLRIDSLLGFRFMRLTESLTMRDNVSPLVDGSGLTFEGPLNGVPLGATLTDADHFRTENHFYGLQLGSGIRYSCKWVDANLWGKIALGASDQEADIYGTTTLHDPLTGAQTAGGGIYALPSNSGVHTRTVLAFVPEGGLNFGVNVLPCLRLTAGYSFLYWSSVVRPGAQIDRFVNPTQVPSDNSYGTLTGAQRPLFRFNEESFWMHTLTFGLDFHY